MSTQIVKPTTPPVPALPPDRDHPPEEARRERVERVRNFPPLREYLVQTCKYVEGLDRSKREDILKQQSRCQGYYDGKQYGKWNEANEWEELPYDPNEFRPVDNQYKIQVDKLLMEMARTGLDLTVEAVDQDSAAMREAAALVKARIDANRRRMFTQHPEFVLSENMALLLKTLTFRYTYFDPNAPDSPVEKRPLFAKKVVGSDASATVCAVCGMRRELPPTPEGSYPTGDNPPPCRNCGSNEVRTLEASAVEVEVPAGEEDVAVGRVETAHVDPTMVNLWLGSRGITSSPFLVYTQMLMRGVVERHHPGKVIPAGRRDGEAERARRENEQSTSNSPFGGGVEGAERGGSQFEQVKYELVWLDSWVYADYVTKREGGEELADGRTLRPGQKLIEMFPQGMCVAKVGDTILDLYAEDKNKKWSMCVYGIREHALHGSGTNALIPVQVTINDLKAYRLANVYFNTAPREFVSSEGIDGGNLPPLNKVCVVTNVPEGRNIVGGVYDKAPGSALPPEVPAFQQEQQGSLQEAAGTSSLNLAGTSSEADGLRTATGIAAMRDLAVGRMGPNLMLKAAMEVEHAYQVVELEQGNYSRQHFLSTVAKRAAGREKSEGDLTYTAEGVEAFLKSNVRADFLISPVPGSWMPTTEPEKKADAVAYAQTVAQIQDPETRAQLAKVFKQPVQLGGWNATEREAARRIEEFAKVAQVIADQGMDSDLEQMGQLVLDSATNARINSEMDNHVAHRAFYLDWWVSDEARTAPMCLRKAVEMRVREHKDAMVESVQADKMREAQVAAVDKGAQVLDQAIDQHMAQGQAEEAQRMGMVDKEHSALLQGVASGTVPMEAAPVLKDAILSQGTEQPAQ